MMQLMQSCECPLLSQIITHAVYVFFRLRPSQQLIEEKNESAFVRPRLERDRDP